MENDKNEDLNNPNIEILVDGNALELKSYVAEVLIAVLEGLQWGLKKIPENASELPHRISIDYGAELEKDRVKLFIGDKKIPLKSFVADMFARTIFGFLTSLHGTSINFNDYFTKKVEIVYTPAG